MENMIEIRSRFNEWMEVTEEKARKYAHYLYYESGWLCIPQNKKIEYIEENYIKGISVKKLLGEE